MLGGCRNDNITRSICMSCSMYTVHMLVHMVCGIRVRTEVMGLDPPWSTCTSIGLLLNLFAFERNKCTFIIITLYLLLYLPPRLHNKERENTHKHTHTHTHKTFSALAL